jgi:hypothetical protein
MAEDTGKVKDYGQQGTNRQKDDSLSTGTKSGDTDKKKN